MSSHRSRSSHGNSQGGSHEDSRLPSSHPFTLRKPNAHTAGAAGSPNSGISTRISTTVADTTLSAPPSSPSVDQSQKSGRSTRSSRKASSSSIASQASAISATTSSDFNVETPSTVASSSRKRPRPTSITSQELSEQTAEEDKGSQTHKSHQNLKRARRDYTMAKDKSDKHLPTSSSPQPPSSHSNHPSVDSTPHSPPPSSPSRRQKRSSRAQRPSSPHVGVDVMDVDAEADDTLLATSSAGRRRSNKPNPLLASGSNTSEGSSDTRQKKGRRGRKQGEPETLSTSDLHKSEGITKWEPSDTGANPSGVPLRGESVHSGGSGDEMASSSQSTGTNSKGSSSASTAKGKSSKNKKAVEDQGQGSPVTAEMQLQQPEGIAAVDNGASTSSSEPHQRSDMNIDEENKHDPPNGSASEAEAETPIAPPPHVATPPPSSSTTPPTNPTAPPANVNSFLYGVQRTTGNSSGRFREMLNNLKESEPTMQMVALQELAEVLSIATEDQFLSSSSSRMSGFDVDEFVRALVRIIKGPETKNVDIRERLRAAGIPDDFPLEFVDEGVLQDLGIASGGDQGDRAMLPELILLACRCLSNLIEALPSSTSHIVQNGGIPALVSKLREVEFIDLAEQVLAVIDKCAHDYPTAVLRADGLCASLQYVDFFALGTQRVAVNIAGSACRGLPSYSYNSGASSSAGSGGETSNQSKQPDRPVMEMVKEVMPTLERLLQYGDAKLVDGVVRCLGRIVDWAWRLGGDQLEEIITPTFLQIIVQLVTPSSGPGVGTGPSNINQPIFVPLLRLLANVSRGSATFAYNFTAQNSLVPVLRGTLCGGTVPDDLFLEDDEGVPLQGKLGFSLSERVVSSVGRMSSEQVTESLALAGEVVMGLPKVGIWALDDVAQEMQPQGPSTETLDTSEPTDGSTSNRTPVGESQVGGKSTLREDVEMKNAESAHTATEGVIVEPDIDKEPQKEIQHGEEGLGTKVDDGDEDDDYEDEPEEENVEAANDPAGIGRRGAGPVSLSVAEQISIRDKTLFGLYQNDPSALTTYSADLIPILIEVHAATAQQSIRRLCVQILLKFLWWCGKVSGAKGLNNVLQRSKTVGAFLSNLIGVGRDLAFTSPTQPQTGKHQSQSSADQRRLEALSSLLAGLQGVIIVMENGPTEYRQSFVREGVVFEVLKVHEAVEKRLEKSLIPNESDSDSSPKEELKIIVDPPAPVKSDDPLIASKRDDKNEIQRAGDHSPDVDMVDGNDEKASSADSPRRSARLKGKEKSSSGPGTESTHADSTIPAPPTATTSTMTSAIDGVEAKLQEASDPMLRLLDRLSGSGARSDGASATANKAFNSSHRLQSVSMVLAMNGERYPESSVQSQIFNICTKILSFYSTEAKSGEGDILMDLKALNGALYMDSRWKPLQEDANDPARVRILTQLAKLFAGTVVGEAGRGVTTFELAESKIVEALSSYLQTTIDSDAAHSNWLSGITQPPHISERIKAFIYVFMNGPKPYPLADDRLSHVPDAFRSLVKRLHSLVSRTEKFDVATAFTGSGLGNTLSSLYEGMLSSLGSVQSPALQLAKQIKIRIMAEEPQNVPKGYQSLMISIHAVATFRSLEEYLKPKVGDIDFGKQSPLSGGNIPEKTATASSCGLPVEVNKADTVMDSTIQHTPAPAEESESADHNIRSEAMDIDSGEEVLKLSTAKGEVEETGEDDDPNESPESEESDEELEEHPDQEDPDEDGYSDEEGEAMDMSDLLIHAEEELRKHRSTKKRKNGKAPEALSADDSAKEQAPPTALDSDEVVDIGDKDDKEPLTPASSAPTDAPMSDIVKGEVVEPTQGNSGSLGVAPPLRGKEPASNVGSATDALLSKTSHQDAHVDKSQSNHSSGAVAWSANPSISQQAVVGDSDVKVESQDSGASASKSFRIEFTLGDPQRGRPIPVGNELTIFSACWHYEEQNAVHKLEHERASQDTAEATNSSSPVTSPINVWAQTYTIYYRKVPEATAASSEDKHPDCLGVSAHDDHENQENTQLQSVAQHDDLSTAKVQLPYSQQLVPGISQNSPNGLALYLLRALYGINHSWEHVYIRDNPSTPHMSVSATGAVDNLPNEELLLASGSPGGVAALPDSAFINSKITAKVARQLDEPLIVASHVLPDWCKAVARELSFLINFDTRWTFFQSTSFGYSRSMMRWQQQQSGQQTGSSSREPQTLGRVQRSKVRISRNRLLDSMLKIMELYSSSQALLEVEFFDEVGTGLGPTLEFYSLVCNEVRKKSRRLWRDDDNQRHMEGEYVNSPRGLFPAPLNAAMRDTVNGRHNVHLFKMLGAFVGKALLDNRIIDLPFHPLFLSAVISKDGASNFGEERSDWWELEGLHYLKDIDPALAQSINHLYKYIKLKHQIEADSSISTVEKTGKLSALAVDGATIEDLTLDFTLPGYDTIELCSGGKDKVVNIGNVEEYVKGVMDLTLGSGVRSQVAAFQQGFDSVFPVTDLKIFTLDELGLLFGGAQNEDWSPETLSDAVKADHGYTSESRAIKYLIEVMTAMTPIERREFIQFVTGSPKLPIGGFRNLSPPLTVVCKVPDSPYQADDYLPSVMTCVNYLKLPDYSKKEVLKAKIQIACSEGRGAFHLS
ncbi:hypothetical protein M427DRAFT_153427 [Gonapodya prolifera JEL478]|uniref:HECT-type E3 ubiquitin transferase n=1 Tax=Gonapodya prolifera (strain JEL478) TaxID=1344416 RepID=A0A139ANG7_GONPJ|nr:hypothetical protein M427DRAFT_153427 [Gonapodya prolifera JEL478]|eukprot:KXS18290.1 hypothetical protein M427DRAFT_153427 [Gonapodya prolifera JEL478]